MKDGAVEEDIKDMSYRNSKKSLSSMKKMILTERRRAGILKGVDSDILVYPCYGYLKLGDPQNNFEDGEF